MARQTPQQKRANDKHAKSIERNMGRPESAYKKKDVQKSPISNVMLGILVFVVLGTMGLGFADIGAAMVNGLRSLLASVGLMSR